MKKLVSCVLIGTILTAALPLNAREELEMLAEETDQLYRTGAGAKDGAFTAVSISVIIWGIGVAIGIAVLAATLNHSDGS